MTYNDIIDKLIGPNCREDEAHVQMLAFFTGHGTRRQLVDALNREGYRTPAGQPFSLDSVKRLIRVRRDRLHGPRSKQPPTQLQLDAASRLFDGLTAAGATTHEALNTILTRYIANTL